MMKKFFCGVVMFLLLISVSGELIRADDTMSVDDRVNGMLIIDENDANIIKQTLGVVLNSANDKTQEEVELFALSFMQGSQPEKEMQIFLVALCMVWIIL